MAAGSGTGAGVVGSRVVNYEMDAREEFDVDEYIEQHLESLLPRKEATEIERYTTYPRNFLKDAFYEKETDFDESGFRKL